IATAAEATRPWAAAAIVEETQPWAASPIVEETQPWAASPIVEETQPWAASPIVEETAAGVAPLAEHADATINLEDPSIDLSDELEGMSGDEDVDADSELFDGERVGVYTISADPNDIELERGNRPL